MTSPGHLLAGMLLMDSLARPAHDDRSRRSHEAGDDQVRVVVVVQPPTEIDIATEDIFASDLEEACASGAGRVVVDFSAVTFCGVAGLALLVDSAGALQSAGRTLVIRNPPPTLVRMAKLTGADQLLGLAW